MIARVRSLRWSWLLLALLLVLMLVQGDLALGQPFRGDIDRWTKQDELHPPRAGSILFTGSSSIRRWEQLAFDFRDYDLIQRGFGGAQFDDLNRYLDEIVLPYVPAAIVIWAGTNDIAAGSEGGEVAADYEEFVQAVRAKQPEVEIFYLGIMPTPGRFGNRPQEAVANSVIAQRAAGDPHLHYIDLPAAFAALDPPEGPEFKSLFVDGIHLSRQGYALWAGIIRPRVTAVIRPNKVYQPNARTPRPGSRLFFDFGPSNKEDGDPTVGPDAHGNLWNNWHAAEGDVAVNAGEQLSNLVDAKGQPTGVGLIITGGFTTNGKLHGGLLAPAADRLGELAVTTASEDYFVSSADNRLGGGDDDRTGGFMLTGLDPSLSYDFRFLGSCSLASESCLTEYLVVGAESKAATRVTSRPNGAAMHNRDSRLATANEVRPDRFGQIFVDLTVVSGTSAYINAMELTVIAPTR